ncbi:MAG: hypothetical protein FWG68_09750 [Defluviitaleaceae bacterium]|nr:hypothetical protein [Defluviitaleaceae bacterium]
MIKTHLKIIIWLIITAAIITACGNGDDPDTTDNNLPAPDPIILDNQPPPNGDPITLTILATSTHTPMIRAVEEDMQEYFAVQGIDFNIALTDYDHEDTNALFEYNEILQTMLAAGDGFDVVFLNSVATIDLRLLADNGFLLNVYDLIDQDPNLTRDDFFTNVLSAMEHRGGLYNFPFTFAFDFMGINASLPDTVLNEFSQKTSLSMVEAMQILNILQTEYPEIYASFPLIANMGEFFSPNAMASRIVASFIDFENATSSFSGAEFVNFANLLRDTIPILQIETFDAANIVPNFETVAEMNHMAENYIFLSVSRRGTAGGDFRNFTTLIPLFGISDSPFLNFVPVTDSNGAISIVTSDLLHTWANVIFPAVGDGTVAWDFTQRMLHRTLTVAADDFVLNDGFLQFGARDLAIPILRNELEPHFHRFIEEWSFFLHNPNFVPLNGIRFGINSPDETAAIAAALERLTELANSPMSLVERRAGVGFGADIMDLFMTGEISAEEFGLEVQERTDLWLAGE